MLTSQVWRRVLFDSARRHNITAMSDLDFAALMAAIVRIESGAIRHQPAQYVDVAFVKSLEILYNVSPWTQLFQGTGIAEKFHLPGYQTEGISNTGFDTIQKLKQGLVPDKLGILHQTTIRVYDYYRSA
jgi:hypothetical protein